MPLFGGHRQHKIAGLHEADTKTRQEEYHKIPFACTGRCWCCGSSPFGGHTKQRGYGPNPVPTIPLRDPVSPENYQRGPHTN